MAVSYRPVEAFFQTAADLPSTRMHISLSFAVVPVLAIALLAPNSARATNDIDQFIEDEKEHFEQTLAYEEEQLLASLIQKRSAAARTGRLDAVERVEKEFRAFDMKTRLPACSYARNYERARLIARVQLEKAYNEAISAHTRAENFERARQLREELEIHKEDGLARLSKAHEKFVIGSRWINFDENNKRHWDFTVIDRQGDAFTAVFVIGDHSDRTVTGTIQDRTISWNRKEVVTRKGSPGAEHVGVLGRDGDGYRIDFRYAHHDPRQAGGTFWLRYDGIDHTIPGAPFVE